MQLITVVHLPINKSSFRSSKILKVQIRPEPKHFENCYVYLHHHLSLTVVLKRNRIISAVRILIIVLVRFIILLISIYYTLF